MEVWGTRCSTLRGKPPFTEGLRGPEFHDHTSGRLASQWLLSVRDLWIKAHGNAERFPVLHCREPPGADPHAG